VTFDAAIASVGRSATAVGVAAWESCGAEVEVEQLTDCAAGGAETGGVDGVEHEAVRTSALDEAGLVKYPKVVADERLR